MNINVSSGCCCCYCAFIFCNQFTVILFLSTFVERASRYSKQYLHSTSLGDYKSDGSDTNPTFSYCSEITRPSDEGGSRYSHLFTSNTVIMY